jgi:hypothetical protein
VWTRPESGCVGDFKRINDVMVATSLCPEGFLVIGTASVPAS